MSVIQADLAKLGVVAEASFGGTATGPLYRLNGAVSVDQKRSTAGREARVNVWRQQESQEQAGGYYEGTIESELTFDRATYLLLSALLTQVDVDLGSGIDTFTLRPSRNDPPAHATLKIRMEVDGRWIEFGGVVVKSTRFTGRSRQVARMTVDWLAATMTVYETTPSWTFTEDATIRRVIGDSVAVGIDGIEHGQALEVTVEVSDPKRLVQLGSDGVFAGWVRDGIQQITGTVTEYEDTAHDLREKAAVLTEAELSIEFAQQGDANWYLAVGLPRVQFDAADPELMRAADTTTSATFKTLQDSALNDASEPLFVFTTPEI